MSYIIIMGMAFEEGNVPDFGSIYRVSEGLYGVHEYGLNSEDVEKLDLITNAVPGSTALCDDTADIYRLTKNGWVMLGAGSQSTRSADASNTSLSSTPLNLGKSSRNLEDIIETEEIIDIYDQIDIKEKDDIEDLGDIQKTDDADEEMR